MASFLFSTLLATQAQAQSFGSARILRAHAELGEEPTPNIFSFAPVLFLGIDNRSGDTKSAGAGVLGIEHGFDLGSKNKSAQIGIFAYSQGGSSTLYQGQGKFYFNHSFGVQANIIKGNVRGNSDTAFFALYNISTRTFDPKALVPWDFQVGLGEYLPGDRSPDSPDSISGFAQLSFNVTKRFSINTSYWGISTGDKSSLSRFLVGGGIAF